MAKPKRLYRLAGVCVNEELETIIKDICHFAKTVSGKEFDSREAKFLVWYIKRWPAVKKYLNRIAFQKEESEIDLGTIKSEFGGG